MRSARSSKRNCEEAGRIERQRSRSLRNLSRCQTMKDDKGGIGSELPRMELDLLEKEGLVVWKES